MGSEPMKICGWPSASKWVQVLTLIGLWSVGWLGPQRLAPAESVWEYNRDVRPILAEHCFNCHGPDSAARKGDLRLDQREAAIASQAIVAGKPEQSGLIERIISDDAELVMPPPETKKHLTAQQKQLLREWIAAGAEYQPHWSFIPPVKPTLPAVADSSWVKNPIDHFILQGLAAKGLRPADPCGPRTLARRLALDLTGLPPTPSEMRAFVEAYEVDADQAIANAIDLWMQSPAWGEHRARYWLDAARYGDTHGLHFDNYREMWPYRDWVIRSFNDNQPFDQFTVDQLAGDLLPQPNDQQLIATGFQRCNMTTNEGGTIDEENLAIYAADRVQTLGWVYLGLTTNCSQCHNHKFDAFTMRDYYSLAAFFRNTTQPPKDGNVKDGGGPTVVVPTTEDAPRWKALPAEIAAVVAQRDERRATAQPDFEKWLASAAQADAATEVAHDGLVTHLTLQEGTGRAVTDQAIQQSFEAAGELSWDASGKLGPALVVNSTATFDLGDRADFNQHDPFSVASWVKIPDEGQGAAIVARLDESAGYRGWDLWLQGRTFAIHLVDQWPAKALKVATRDAIPVGQWQHVGATYDGSGKPAGVKLFVNGREVPTKVEADSLDNTTNIRVATSLRLGQRSHGQALQGTVLQDVRLYHRQLSAAEVQTLATYAQLATWRRTPESERTAEQRGALLEHFLTTVDTIYQTHESNVQRLEAEREAIRGRAAVTHVQQERTDTAPMAHVLLRGEYDRPAEQVDANTPAALHPFAAALPKNRLGLAQWLVDPNNPLTARVTVNRFWQQVFGRGIVATPEDFGVMGMPPSHPELLDWLAVDFQEHGWDVKRLFKLMLTSATYRQSAESHAAKREADPDNAWLSRGPRYRMDAEMVRDYALSVSGLLSPRMYGPSVKPYQPEEIWNMVGLPGGNTRDYVPSTGEDLYRRTVYSFWKRMAPPPNLEAFNAPSREVCTVRRERTNTPLQALVTLNDPQFVESARRLAQTAIHDASASSASPSQSADDPRTIADQVSMRVLGRQLAPAEQAILLADYEAYASYYSQHPDEAAALVQVGESARDESIQPERLAAWTMVCNQVLNLDETINK